MWQPYNTYRALNTIPRNVDRRNVALPYSPKASKQTNTRVNITNENLYSNKMKIFMISYIDPTCVYV